MKDVAVEAALDVVCSRSSASRRVLRAALTLAREIAREGREGRPVGTLLTIGDPARVLSASRPLILDPLAGHAPASTHVSDPRLRGTLKELAQIDGAFVLAEDGSVVSAGRYLEVSPAGIDIPLGLGARHVAAAAASKQLEIVTIAVSQAGTVRVFCAGEIVAALPP